MLVLFVVLEGMVWHRGLKFSLATKERRTALTYLCTSVVFLLVLHANKARTYALVQIGIIVILFLTFVLKKYCGGEKKKKKRMKV